MKENIKKNLLFTILVFLSLTIHAQKYQGSIVDSESQTKSQDLLKLVTISRKKRDCDTFPIRNLSQSRIFCNFATGFNK